MNRKTCELRPDELEAVVGGAMIYTTAGLYPPSSMSVSANPSASAISPLQLERC